VEAGENVFMDYCQACHGKNAMGTARNWTQRLEDGSLPPPPLNGTAHAWHHDFETLVRTIERGGEPVGGNMPPFGKKLTEDEIIEVIAFIQSLWPNEVRQYWIENFSSK